MLTVTPLYSNLETRALKLLFSAIIFLMTTLSAFAQQQPSSTPAKSSEAGTTPQSISDPTKLESKTVAEMQTFSIEKLYMTRAIGGTTWSPDGSQVAFISNISGRNNLWIVPARGGWPTQLTISDQRQLNLRLPRQYH